MFRDNIFKVYIHFFGPLYEFYSGYPVQTSVDGQTILIHRVLNIWIFMLHGSVNTNWWWKYGFRDTANLGNVVHLLAVFQILIYNQHWTHNFGEISYYNFFLMSIFVMGKISGIQRTQDFHDSFQVNDEIMPRKTLQQLLTPPIPFQHKIISEVDIALLNNLWTWQL
jgi:hypothetical protein